MCTIATPNEASSKKKNKQKILPTQIKVKVEINNTK
jgi:hypothetical protein